MLNLKLQNDFYKYFSSKEVLIEECLRRRILEVQTSLLDKVNSVDDPLNKLKSIFNWYIDWINTEDFSGCLFKSNDRSPAALSFY